MRKDLERLFLMTRRERRGTVVLLVLVAAVMIVASIADYWKGDMPQNAAYTAAVEACEAQADSAGIAEEQPARPKRDKPTKRAKRRPPSKPKPASGKPRPLDPVPQF